VIEAYVQEIDIRTGRVLFSWNAADHVPYSQSEQPLPASASTPWDWFHVNAVKPLADGNLLIDARDTWTTYKVNGDTGQIIWRLGGKDSSFTLAAAPGQSLNDAGEIFSWQHDPEQVGPDEYTVFDNESAGVANTGVGSTSEFGYARVVTIKLNQWTHTATLVASDNEPQGEVATSQGNGQRLPGGGELVGWGILPDVSEFDASGALVFNAEFPTGVNTYRAYLLPWNAPAAGGWGQAARAVPAARADPAAPAARADLVTAATAVAARVASTPPAVVPPQCEGRGRTGRCYHWQRGATGDADRRRSGDHRPSRQHRAWHRGERRRARALGKGDDRARARADVRAQPRNRDIHQRRWPNRLAPALRAGARLTGDRRAGYTRPTPGRRRVRRCRQADLQGFGP
jgi:hypothetical protein